MDKRPPMTRRQRIRTLVRLGLITLGIAGILILGSLLLSFFGLDNLTQEQIRQIIDGFGVWAPLAFILITFLQVTFVPIPFVVSILAGNLLFGFWGAFLYSLVGSVLGSVFAFSLGRWIGRPFVNWAFGDEDVVNHYLSKTQGKEFVVFFFMFLLPFFPDDALCALAGITSINKRQFYFIQLVARPTTILGNLLIWTGKFSFASLYGIIVIVLLVIFAIVGFYYSFKHADVINRYFNRCTEYLTHKYRAFLGRRLHAFRLHASRKWRKMTAAMGRVWAPVSKKLAPALDPIVGFYKKIDTSIRSFFNSLKTRIKNKIEQNLEEKNKERAEKLAKEAAEDAAWEAAKKATKEAHQKSKHASTAKTNLDAVDSNSDAVNSDPDAINSDPDAINSDPDAVNSDPDAINSDPDTTDATPYVPDSNPDVIGTEVDSTEKETAPSL